MFLGSFPVESPIVTSSGLPGGKEVSFQAKTCCGSSVHPYTPQNRAKECDYLHKKLHTLPDYPDNQTIINNNNLKWTFTDFVPLAYI